LGKFFSDLSSGGASFRFKPENEFQPQIVNRFTEFFDTVGKVDLIGKPISDSVGKTDRKPRRIEPVSVTTRFGKFLCKLFLTVYTLNGKKLPLIFNREPLKLFVSSCF
jgi:hypothetical protein